MTLCTRACSRSSFPCTRQEPGTGGMGTPMGAGGAPCWKEQFPKKIPAEAASALPGALLGILIRESRSCWKRISRRIQGTSRRGWGLGATSHPGAASREQGQLLRAKGGFHHPPGTDFNAQPAARARFSWESPPWCCSTPGRHPQELWPGRVAPGGTG